MFNTEQEVIFALVSLIVTILLCFLIFFLFTVFTQRKVQRLQKKLLQAEILSIERERERISYDLHDSVNPTISALILLTSQIEPLDEVSFATKLKIIDKLKSVSLQIDNISRNIIPKLYDGTTVDFILQKVIQDFRFVFDISTITITLNTNASVNLGKEGNLHVYRIMQELLHNTYKHSKASEVYINSNCTSNTIFITYRDNGIGFDPMGNNPGLGFSSIENRVSLLNGTYSVDSENSKGVSVYFSISKPQ